MPSINRLTEKIAALDYVQDFQKAEARLRQDAALWQDYEQMKALQKEAVLYQHIGKMQAFKETSQAAQRIEKRLKSNPLVGDYFLKMQDVSDLLQHVTGEIERQVNEALCERKDEA